MVIKHCVLYIMRYRMWLNVSRCYVWICLQVWPVLVLIGGLDEGLRVGGGCSHISTQREGIVLGVTKLGSSNVRVQWTDSDKSVRFVLFHSNYQNLCPDFSNGVSLYNKWIGIKSYFLMSFPSIYVWFQAIFSFFFLITLNCSTVTIISIERFCGSFGNTFPIIFS